MIKNEPTIKGGIIDLNRGQIQQRAAVYGYHYQLALQFGIDAVATGKMAIGKLGEMNANDLLHNMDQNPTILEFTNAMFNPLIQKTNGQYPNSIITSFSFAEEMFNS